MTASTVQQTIQVKDSAAARRRRRSAPAGAAADDCFTCAKRNVKCDRRRPYCSQCLEIGNDCSGYKTQLTWGVGVASRGKLRGRSLPIASSPPAAEEPPAKNASRPRAGLVAAANNTRRAVQWTEQDKGRRTAPLPTPRGPIDIPHASRGPTAFAPGTPHDMTMAYLPQMQHGSWSSVSYPPALVQSQPEYCGIPSLFSTLIDTSAQHDWMDVQNV